MPTLQIRLPHLRRHDPPNQPNLDLQILPPPMPFLMRQKMGTEPETQIPRPENKQTIPMALSQLPRPASRRRAYGSQVLVREIAGSSRARAGAEFVRAAMSELPGMQECGYQVRAVLSEALSSGAV